MVYTAMYRNIEKWQRLFSLFRWRLVGRQRKVFGEVLIETKTLSFISRTCHLLHGAKEEDHLVTTIFSLWLWKLSVSQPLTIGWYDTKAVALAMPPTACLQLNSLHITKYPANVKDNYRRLEIIGIEFHVLLNSQMGCLWWRIFTVLEKYDHKNEIPWTFRDFNKFHEIN